MDLKFLVIVQARVGSTRFPGKVLKKINGKSLIEILLFRLSQSRKIDKIVLATSQNKENNRLETLVQNLGYEVYRGSEKNVLSRYYEIAKKHRPEVIIRITGDCPIIDYNIIDEIITIYEKEKFDYLSNTFPPSFPDGLDVELFTYNCLVDAYKNAKSFHEKEHVTPYMRGDNSYKKFNLANSIDLSGHRWTVDNAEDFIVITKIIEYFSPSLTFSWEKVYELTKNHPEYFMENKFIKRNEGSRKNTGQKLWERAKKIIPGGTMLLSKRPEMFLPNSWPSYFNKTKGCHVWDLDKNKYVDMSIMGVGTNILGYSNSDVDDAVRSVIDSGNLSTLNCPEEVYLAEKLIELHPWSDMVRFARTGGEANAIAIRIARAATGKQNVAFCGYHGWHDWYLSANLGEKKSLDGHLLPGLDPKGVPESLKGTMFPFNYNNFEQLQEIVKYQDIGVIKMEVFRNFPPTNDFLLKVRKLATENNIVLIFDECTSGFRTTFGGMHIKYGIEPDLAVFGKALGNGYAITAVIGKSEIMKEAENTFISSTFWTERIGSVAALKTLEIMEKEQSWIKITNIGENIIQNWELLGKKHNLPLKVGGMPAIVNFVISVPNWIKYKTYITQEMLKNGFLASNSIYVSISHTEKLIDKYFSILDKIFQNISDCENGKNIDILLNSPVSHTGFKRLN